VRTTFVVSDIHLFDRPEAFLFNAEKEQAFVRLCEIVRESDGQLVFNGDIFDITGMRPCPNGMAEFFVEAVPPELLNHAIARDVSRMRSCEEILLAVKAAFPHFFSAIVRLIAEKRLVFIPGNHDCELGTPDGQEIFARVAEVKPEDIRWHESLAVGEALFITHGNQFDIPNRTGRTCLNRGALFTSALYQGLLPALAMLGVENSILAAIPAVRPEEATITGIEHYLGEDPCRKLLVALARLLQRNGFFRGFSAIPAWFLSHDFPVLSHLVRKGVTAARIRSLLPQEKQLMAMARLGAYELRLKNAQKVIVLGHTHELDFHPHYVNLGTWIDHISGITPTDIEQAEEALPVLILSESGEIQVKNIRGLSAGGSLENCVRLSVGFTSARN
jgi:UDP-2,3-diacylglucosamine pyrophosphatase LpxH